MITEEEQLWPEHISNAMRKNQLQVFVKSIPQERVALVTHSSWLKYYTVGSVEPELQDFKLITKQALEMTDKKDVTALVYCDNPELMIFDPLEHMIRCETQIGQGSTFLINDPISINHLLTNV